MRKIAAFGLVVLLASCGADGEPVEPSANVGVSVGTSGVNAGASVGVRKGPVSINVSVF